MHGNATHGMRNTLAYRVHQNMKQRCLNPKNPQYKNYGGIGIIIEDPKWLQFENFYDDMGDCPPGMTLERINNNRGYCKDNCKWATYKEQNNNKRNNIKITYDGKTQNLSQWAEEYNITHDVLWHRLETNWPFEKAINTPVRS